MILWTSDWLSENEDYSGGYANDRTLLDLTLVHRDATNHASGVTGELESLWKVVVAYSVLSYLDTQ